MKIYVLRIGHRPERDKRITTHVGLVARAFGANGFVLGDINDERVIESLNKVLKKWGGSMEIISGVNSIRFIKEWKRSYGEVIHLTMYGLPIDYVIDKIKRSRKNKLIIVGAEKVSPEYYRLADYNVSIGNQPHSEVSALAIFLDRLFEGKELYKRYPKSKIEIVPQERGKKVVLKQ
ncbi:MAG: tRNA (cytidine(56)-2'-O)-methyltransferase [Desulfurococcales archaeon ex4484_217_2]|nr:MAG: tRNA (cytidine(56)-2'-O)-methyltransferase [Desulfurococcales archaeon ex4484_217_2]